jgi:starch synthase (maltosyl-transferring)
VQALARRLAATAGARRPWPGAPVPVALVITELDVGGAEKALVTLARGLDRRRWEPSVIALGPEAPLAEPVRAAGVSCECLGVDPRRPLRAVGRLAEALRRVRPALVQSFLFHANVAARLAAPWAWARDGLGHGSGSVHGPGRSRPWVLGGLRVAERQKRWHLALERATARLAAGAVCVSDGVHRFSLEAGGWPADRLTVIPNAVELAPFDRDGAGAGPLPRAALPGLGSLPEGAFLALFVGRLNVQKGLPTLLEAFDRVAAARPGLDWHLALAGDGPERDRLRADASTRPALAGRVHWLGHRGDVPALLGASDLLVLPSLWEGMPNVVLEAMAARRAVVATAVEGTVDLVAPGETGWLVPPGDPDALAAALLDAAADPDRLRRFGDAARARAEAEFAPGRTVLAYERLWAGVLGYEDPAIPSPDFADDDRNRGGR